MSIMIPSCNARAYMKFSKKNVAVYAKNVTVKNIITIKKYNVGMKSLDRAIIILLVTLLRQKHLQVLFLRFGFRFRLWFWIPNSGFSIRPSLIRFCSLLLSLSTNSSRKVITFLMLSWFDERGVQK